jgi:hypothetical protein
MYPQRLDRQFGFDWMWLGAVYLSTTSADQILSDGRGFGDP